MNNTKSHYHFFANGDDAKGFIISDTDYRAAFNRFGVCAWHSRASVLSFSIEDTHPHALLYGTFMECDRFKSLFELISKRYIAATRGNLDGVALKCEIYQVSDIEYLRNVGTYTIVQPTKDGKSVMPYDYFWGTGSLYFRDESHLSRWIIGKDGKTMPVKTLGSYSLRTRRRILHSKKEVPEEWCVCNGILLPENYVNIRAFESIYQSHNRFRVFKSSNKQRQEEVIRKMADVRGVMIDDLEARKICLDECNRMHGIRDIRRLTPSQRLELALTVRRTHMLSIRQIATIVRLPMEEVQKYL